MLNLWKLFGGNWDESKQGLQDDLEHIEAAVNQFYSQTFDREGKIEVSALPSTVPLSILPTVAASHLLGRGDEGEGTAEVITLGSGLSMSGTTLNATAVGDGVTGIGPPGRDGEDGDTTWVIPGPPGPTGATGAAGGNLTSTAAEASLPGSPSSGDLFLPNDGYWLQRYAGAAWVPWGPLFPFTDPSLAGLSTWVNQGSATVTTANGGIVLFGPAGGNTNNTILRVKTAPSTPYTITAAIMPCFPLKNYLGCGVAFRESGSGKLQNVGVGFNTALTPSYIIQAEKWTTATAASAAYVTVGGPTTNLIFLRITDNGTNRISSFSTDGQNFHQFHSVSRTDFLTADQVGIFVMTQNAATTNYGVFNTLLSWKET